MLEYLRDFFTDKAVFVQTVGRWALPIRAALGALALAVSSGQLDLGPAGWWSGPVLLLASFLIRGGDKNVPVIDAVRAMPTQELVELKQHIQHGVGAPPEVKP